MKNKPRVLVVDDENKVLQGLQEILRPNEEEWELDFRTGGAEALEAMAIKPFNVLISDMRMPDMNGAQLLNTSMRLYPSTVRMILSGHSDYELLNQCLSATQQFLEKPCKASALIGSITQAIALKDLLDNEHLRGVVTDLKTLPSQPALYTQILERLQEPKAHVKDIVQIVERDPAMAAQILKLVNSAFFGLTIKVSSLEEAVSYIGLHTLRLMVLSLGLFREFSEMEADPEWLDSIWSHSIETARIARIIVETEGGSKIAANEAFTAGLLHDIGELIFAVNFREQYQDCINYSREHCEPMFMVEKSILGAPHSYIGAYLLGLWGLPTVIVEAVAWHHLPSDSGRRFFCALTAVHVADVLIHQQKRDLKPIWKIDRAHLEQIYMGDRLPIWQKAARNL